MASPDNLHPVRRLALRALVPPAAFAVSTLATALVTTSLGASLLEVRPAEQRVAAVRTLLEEHHCWTATAPARSNGTVPGHVVVTRHGDATPRIRGERVVHAALEQLFAGRDAGLVVHGFCP